MAFTTDWASRLRPYSGAGKGGQIKFPEFQDFNFYIMHFLFYGAFYKILICSKWNQVLGLVETKGRLRRITMDRGHPQNEAIFKRAAQKISLITE